MCLLSHSPVETVQQFTSLGSEICMEGGSYADVECRIKRAKGTAVV